MQISIINQPLNNRGDEAAHRALLRRLNAVFPQAKIEVLFLGTPIDHITPFKVISDTISYINIPPRWNRIYTCMRKGWYTLAMLHIASLQFMHHLLKADFVICAPGGICLGGFQDIRHLLTLCMTKATKRKLLYWGRSIGPFSDTDEFSSRFKKKAVELLQYCQFISLRDTKSQKIADELGVHYQPTLDTAFLECPKAEIPPEVAGHLQQEYVVFVPNNVSWHYKYQNVEQNRIDNFWKQVIGFIRKKYPDSQIVMLPQTYNTVKQDGYYYFKTIASQSGLPNIYVLEDSYGSDIQQNIISKSQCVVGARYHSIVFAINNGIPFLALSYEHKIAGLLEALNANDNMVDIEKTFFDEDMYSVTLNKINERLPVRSFNNELQHNAKSITEKCFQDLVNLIQKD